MGDDNIYNIDHKGDGLQSFDDEIDSRYLIDDVIKNTGLYNRTTMVSEQDGTKAEDKLYDIPKIIRVKKYRLYTRSNNDEVQNKDS